MKRRVLIVVSFIFTIITAMAIFAACGGAQNNKESGSEAGTYYCDYEGSEYTLTLGEKCTFTLKIGSETQEGEYDLEGEALVLTPASGTAINATYKNDTVTLTYSDVTYVFLRKVEYTVKFDTDGGSTIADQKVVNGRTAQKPDAPTKGDEIFVGWYTDESHRNPFYFTQPITKDTTLHARYVDRLDPEFKISFELGYEGAVAPAPVETAGNKIYVEFIEEPVWAGHEFLGWYYSDFENKEELTAQFTSETTVKQNMTLYAVWKDDKPIVSVTSEGVSIAAAGTNAAYNLKITAPDGTETPASGALATGSTTVYQYNFAEHEEGKYTVEVEVNGQTTTRYFNNKALARVSAFSVVNRTLRFNEVENATDYKLTVICGTEGHTHNEISLGQDANGKPIVSYDFSECDMPAEGGIRFIVKATADGYVPSVSEEYEFTETLDAVKNIEFDAATGLVKWAADENATSYLVTVICDHIAVAENDEVLTNSYSVKEIGKGAIEIRIVPVAFGWKSPAAATYTFQKTTLAAPTNVHFADNAIVWDAVEGATGYEIHIGSVTKTTTGNDATSYTVLAADFGEEDEAEVTVYALNGNTAETSCASDAVTVSHSAEIKNLVYEHGKLTWSPVFGYENLTYEVKIGENGAVQTATSNSIEISFDEAGTQTIYVRMLEDGHAIAGVDWPHIDVEVYTVEFIVDTIEWNESEEIYLAAGDAISLPDRSWIGYEFDGWYTAPDGEEGEGTKYTSTTFAGGDLQLYANFKPLKFTIYLEVDGKGELPSYEFEVEYRQSGFTLPTPEPSSVEYTFQGWYRGVGGTGARFADTTGGNTGTYTLLKDITVYAKWTTPFSYTRVEGGYSISAGSAIGDATEITIPSTHNGALVVTVEDFNAGASLEIINIPDTVKTISLGSIGKAFESLTKLRAINIYKVEDNRDPVYASKDGMVYEVEGNRLVYVPIAYKTPEGSTEVTLPENIQTIVAGAIYKNTTITKLTIPASVREVQVNAIYGSGTSSALQEIIFLSDTAEDASLTLADKAIYYFSNLTKITIPKYTEEFSSAKWNSCSKLESINVDGSKRGDSIFTTTEEDDGVGGVLCRTIKNGQQEVYEIVYYPTARTAATYKIPDYITSIGDAAFKGELDFTSLEIPAQITNIGKEAFYGGTNSKLATLTFKGTAASNDLTVGESAFASTKLTTLTLPANLVKTGFKAFYTGSSTTAGLEDIYLTGRGADSAAKVPDLAMGTFGITSASAKQRTLHIDATYPAIDLAKVFAHPGTSATSTPSATKLTKIEIETTNPNYKRPTVGQDGYGAIFNSDYTKILFLETKTANFTIPATVTEITGYTFMSNTTLTSITIPATVTSIADFAFYKCTKLESVTFALFVAPEGSPDAKRAPLSIGRYAFSGCNNAKLTQIELPDTTTYIGDYAFESMKLTSFVVPGSVKTIGVYAFRSCSAMETVTINEGVLSIGDYAFTYCTKLKTISIPSTVTSLGSAITSFCSDLEDINVAEESKNYKSVDGVLYETKERPGSAGVYDAVTLLSVPAKNDGENGEGTLRIPATVTLVPTRAGQYLVNIKSVQFAEKVVAYTEDGSETMGDLTLEVYAFMGPTAGSQIATVHLPAGLSVIGESAFSSCKALTTINIPYTVTSIGATAFAQAILTTEGLTFDETPEGVEPVPLTLNPTSGSSGGAFKQLAAITEITLPERTTEIGGYTFAYDNLLEKVVLPSTLTSLPDHAFANASSYPLPALTEVVFPKTVPNGFTIGSEAFNGGSAGAGITSIGTANQKEVTLDDGTQVTVPFLPEGITHIDAGAFNYTRFTAIGFPASLESIGSGGYLKLFGNCANLETIAFADNCALEILGKGGKNGDGSSSIVEDSTNLKNFVFGKNMKIKQFGEIAAKSSTSISSISSFVQDAPLLKSITIPASVESIGYNAFKGLVGLTSIKFEEGSHLQKIYDSAFAGTGITDFTFPNATDDTGTTSEIVVAEGAFEGCASLTKMNLSKSIWNITGLFTGCSALETITADEESEYFKVDTNQKIIFGLGTDGAYDTMLYVYGYAENTVTIPEGTLEIATGAYKGQTGITALVLPASLVKIDANAFENCLNLASVTINVPEETVSSLSIIDDDAFLNCWKLSSFDFAKAVNLNRIGAEAFCYTALKTVDLSKCTQLASPAAGSTVYGIGNYAFANITALGTEPIDPNVAAEKQVSVAFPRQIGTFGTNVFNGDTALTRIDLSNVSFTTLPVGTFQGCTSLTDVKLPAGLATIGQSAFQSAGITSFNFSAYAALTTINMYAFRYAPITSVVLPATIETLGNYVFADCTQLTSADLSACTQLDALGSNLFNGDTELETVNLPTTITSIGSSAFKNCTSISGITIPEGVTSLGANAFEGSTFTSITLPASLESIGNYAFQNNTELATIDLSGTVVTSIGSKAFLGCTSLKTVTLSDTLETIGTNAFDGTGITAITLPASCTAIGKNAFQNCAQLATVTINATEVTVGESAFSNCTSLTSFEFGKMTTVGTNAFENTGFTEVTLPGATGAHMFENCTKLTSVTLGENVTSIAASAFVGCENLATVNNQSTKLVSIMSSAFKGTKISAFTVPEAGASELVTLAESAFEGTKLVTIDLSGTQITTIGSNGSAFKDCTELTTVILPDTVKTIGHDAFSGCSSLNNITMNGVTTIGERAFKGTAFTTFKIGKDIQSIGGGAFGDCAELTTFTVEDNNLFEVGDNGELYFSGQSNKGKALIAYPMTAKTFELAADVETIDADAISGYKLLPDGTSEFTVPASVKWLWSYAFRGFIADKVIIPDGITTISNYAFAESKIKKIEFQGSATALTQDYLFANSTLLEEVTLPAALTKIVSHWFEGCTSLTNITIPEKVTSIESYAFKDTGIKELTIPEKVTKFGNQALADMPSLVTVHMNAKVTSASSAGSDLFQNDMALRTVTFGTGFKAIGSSWFKNLTDFTTITLGANINNIGGSAFENTGLTAIELPTAAALTLGSAVFRNTKLTTVTIPGNVATIPLNTFEGCTQLKWVYIEEGVTTINNSAFLNCTALQFVNIPSTVSTIGYCFKGAEKVHVFLPATVMSLGTSDWWFPTESNHLYFGASLYTIISSQGVNWLTENNFDNITFESNYKAAYDASGLTDEDNFPLKPDAADANGFAKAD